MNVIYLLFKKSWYIVFWGSLASLISGITNTISIALINRAINDKILLDTFIYQFILLIFVVIISSMVSQILLTYLSQSTICKLRLLLSAQIANSPLQQIERIGSNRLLATFSGDIQAISYACFLLPDLLTDLAIVISCVIYLLLLNFVVFGIVISLLTLGVISYHLLEAQAKKALLLAREQEDNLYKHFQGLIDGIKELKLNFRRRKIFLESEIQPTAKLCRNKNILGNIIFATAETWGRILFFVTIGLTIFVVPNLVNINSQQLSYYVVVIIFMTRPIESIINTVPALSKASIALKKIDSLEMSKATEISKRKPTYNTFNKINSLELKNISYQYYSQDLDNNFHLGAINLKLFSGEIVFFVGGNGSGKSTLAKLIAGLYIPNNGKIELNNITIDDGNRDWYSQHFSAIFSDYYLFDRLLDFKYKQFNSQIQKYLVKLNLHHKVYITNGCLSTIALSQGERKRLALLTTYLEDRPIYLFDEWASDQDPCFREVFYTQILQELKSKGKTVLVISHDDRYFHLADRLIKLNYGQIQSENLVDKRE
ncbi:MAG: cyclic peptide export ABC transporter [Cyanobacteria bacterium P01_A01_bin.40]